MLLPPSGGEDSRGKRPRPASWATVGPCRTFVWRGCPPGLLCPATREHYSPSPIAPHPGWGGNGKHLPIKKVGEQVLAGLQTDHDRRHIRKRGQETRNKSARRIISLIAETLARELR